MGVAKAAEIVAGLTNAGKAATTPIAIVQNGTTRAQRTVRGELGQLAELIAQQAITAPAVIIVGEVTQLADELNWFTGNTQTEARWSDVAFNADNNQ